jgi:hypothetical protein
VRRAESPVAHARVDRQLRFATTRQNDSGRVRPFCDSIAADGAILGAMGEDRAPDRRGELGEPPSDVRITVFPDPDARRLRELAREGIRVLMRAHGRALVVVVVVAITAMIAIVASGTGRSAPQGNRHSGA